MSNNKISLYNYLTQAPHHFNFCAQTIQPLSHILIPAIDRVDVAQNRATLSCQHTDQNNHGRAQGRWTHYLSRFQSGRLPL